jgi:DNA-binding CsgD family transcriptional regulator
VISRAIGCPVFVGREDELEALTGARRALSKSDGSVILIGGEAGIGKSRLVRQFLGTIVRDPRPRNLATVACQDGAQQAFGPVRSIIASFQQSHVVVAQTPEIARALEQLAPRTSMEPAFDTWDLFASLVSYLQALAAKRATILVIEDIHWADRSSLEFLAYLAPRVADHRLLIVATYRSEEVEMHEGLFAALSRLSRERTVTQIFVEPFGSAEMQRLIEATLPASSAVDRDTIAAITKRAEGNPFYAEELLKDALDSRKSERATSLPISIRFAILERLAQLDAADRRVITHAAVLGQRFEAEILAITLGITIDEVLPSLRRGRDLNIFVEDDSTPVRFRFRHALTRQAIYDDVLLVDARRHHERLLQTIEALGEPLRHVESLAYHATASRNRPKALLFNEMAANVATTMAALPEARVFFERAFEDAAGPEDQARLNDRIAQVLEMQGEVPDAIARFERALGGYSALEQGDLAAGVVRRIAVNKSNLGDRTCVAYGLDFLERNGPRLTAGPRDELLALLARLSMIQYEFELAARLVARVENANELPPLALMNYLLVELDIQTISGDVTAWRSTAERLLTVASRLPAFNAVILYVTIAQSASSLGRSDVFDIAFAAAEAVEGGPKFSGIRSFAEAVRALHRYMLGDIAGARIAIARSLEIGDLPVARMALWLVKPLIATATGDSSLVTADDERGILDLQAVASHNDDGSILASLAAWKLAQGKTTEAKSLLRSALDCLGRPSPGGATALVLFAHYAEGSELEKLEQILAAPLHESDIVDRASVTLARAVLACRMGDEQDALRLALEAARSYRALRWPLMEARALEVAERVQDARDIYERCGAIKDVARISPASEALRPKPLERMLTDRERSIAALIGRGQTNAQIGDQLAISIKTVEKHVSSIFAKFGVRNRVQIAALLAPGERPLQ